VGIILQQFDAKFLLHLIGTDVYDFRAFLYRSVAPCFIDAQTIKKGFVGLDSFICMLALALNPFKGFVGLDSICMLALGIVLKGSTQSWIAYIYFVMIKLLVDHLPMFLSIL
jgi:hypothetical protein